MFSEFCLSSLLICIVIISVRPTIQAYTIILLIEFIDLYNLVIGLQAYTLYLMIIFVLICAVGINAVRAMM